MKLSLTLCAALLALFARTVQAADTLPFDHVHIGVSDPAKAVAWYHAAFGGETTPEGTDRLVYGTTRVVFLKSDTPRPSAGTAIDHVGFSVADLDAKMKAFETAGVKVVTPARDVPGLFKLAFIEDPWGVKIEVVQDAETPGFHHVHLRAPDPPAALAWYADTFGGDRVKLRGQIDAIKYGDVWLLVQRGEATPSAGAAIDHIGWRATDLDAKAAELKGKGVKFTTEPRPFALNGATLHISYVEGPAAVKIEVLQR